MARQLGYDDPDELRRDVSLAARWIGHAVDLTVRAAQGAVPQRRLLSFTRRERRPEYVEADHGLIIHGGEVALGRRASASDPLIGLRAGALAASRGLMLSPVTADNLGRLAPALPVPWPAEAREALLEMLSSGAGTGARSGRRWTWPAASSAGSPAGSRSGRGHSTTRCTGSPSTGTRCRRSSRPSGT